jgi:hypothetical protein
MKIMVVSVTSHTVTIVRILCVLITQVSIAEIVIVIGVSPTTCLSVMSVALSVGIAMTMTAMQATIREI